MNRIFLEDFQNIYNTDLDWERLKDATIIITGATGMIASYIIHYLMYLNKTFNYDTKIICLIRNMDKAKAIFKEYSSKPCLQLYRYKDLANITSGNIDYVIHSASPSSNYNVDPISVIETNVLYTNKLLDVYLMKGIQGFLYLSSGEVNGVINKDIITENDYGYLDPTEIRNVYGESKRSGEMICQSYFHQYAIPTFCARLVHTYSPTMDLINDKRVFSEFITNILNNENITMKSDGMASRNFCYISDATDAIFRIILKGTAGQSYNVGCGDKIKIKDLAQLLVDMFPDKKLKIIFGKQDSNYLESKIKDYPIYSINKLKQLGYNPKVSVRDGFLRTIYSFQL